MDNIGKVVSTKTCRSCGKILREEWNFCPFCETSVEIIKCHSCGKDIKSHWSFCPYCTKEIRGTDSYDRQIDMGNEWLINILNNK